MDDEHACRITKKTYPDLSFSHRVVCRCGYVGPERHQREQALADRLAHKRSVDVPNWRSRSDH